MKKNMSDQDKPGNVAVLCFSPNSGGMELSALKEVENISRSLAACYLVVREGTWLHKKAESSGFTVLAVRFSGSFSISGARQMRRIWRKYSIENLVFLGSSEIKTIHFSLGKSVKSFIVRHGTTKSSPKKDFVRRLTWSRVTAHWCISHHIEKNVRELFPIGDADVFVNYLAQEKVVDGKLPVPAKLDGKDFHLAHSGRLVQGKGQQDAIAVIRKLRDQGIPATLTLFGSGPNQDTLQALCDGLGVSEHVKFAGFVDSPYKQFNKFHGFIFPSRGEGLGESFLEALSSGMHCFCYGNTVFPELQELGFSFSMVENGNVDELSRAVKAVWEGSLPPPKQNIDLSRDVFSLERTMQILRKYLK